MMSVDLRELLMLRRTAHQRLSEIAAWDSRETMVPVHEHPAEGMEKVVDAARREAGQSAERKSEILMLLVCSVFEERLRVGSPDAVVALRPLQARMVALLETHWVSGCVCGCPGLEKGPRISGWKVEELLGSGFSCREVADAWRGRTGL